MLPPNFMTLGNSLKADWGSGGVLKYFGAEHMVEMMISDGECGVVAQQVATAWITARELFLKKIFLPM
jgi:hypothetical protein